MAKNNNPQPTNYAVKLCGGNNNNTHKCHDLLSVEYKFDDKEKLTSPWTSSSELFSPEDFTNLVKSSGEKRGVWRGSGTTSFHTLIFISGFHKIRVMYEMDEMAEERESAIFPFMRGVLMFDLLEAICGNVSAHKFCFWYVVTLLFYLF